MEHAKPETQATVYLNFLQECGAFQKRNHSKTNIIKDGNNRHENEINTVTERNAYVNVHSQQATEKGKLFKYFWLYC